MSNQVNDRPLLTVTANLITNDLQMLRAYGCCTCRMLPADLPMENLAWDKKSKHNISGPEQSISGPFKGSVVPPTCPIQACPALQMVEPGSFHNDRGSKLRSCKPPVLVLVQVAC